ncbi:2-(1,2-epoxy-1,2-dihydrophenyl)acetyl-CoA isomerase [Actinocorallia herbida]|uniref:2-(1,2-epoxy-1,2-dihydrophenyl)acetyl-CoA isomerase n=1 Tax=Actinocorallia herbida TaxID=58109 RepID=A0A3N1CVB4_9ACTN|nr:enoyl-CoA hydratase/isomerase family protein [Actinocorallia herbida]ROO85174.1 2-(1,2-epoxy-1,2-dihydrophenyl)acetyl-CoA isomerase [Actinocorallia herbida]
MSDEPPVLYEPGEVTRLTFNRPRVKNALDSASWALFGDGLERFAEDDDARVLVLSGAGGEFSSGADLSGNINASADQVTAKMREIASIIVRLHTMPKPTLARVDGVAAGVGMSLALGCDLVLASERARFGAVFSRVGLSPDGGLSWLLPRLVGPHKAKELTLLGRIVDAPEAAALGLANLVVPAPDLDATVTDWTTRLAALSPAAASGTLSVLDASWTASFPESLEHEATAQQHAVAALRARNATAGAP